MEASDLVREGGEAVLLEGEHLQLGEIPDLLRQGGELILGKLEGKGKGGREIRTRNHSRLASFPISGGMEVSSFLSNWRR